ncbi:HNH endonuclease [Peribacillus sp. YIM B13477]|uniref:HNH endonuclease n=1 Tax=Peribacillus sp. YIM B13477 TaxID=3366300 RepID=UPI00366EB2FE
MVAPKDEHLALSSGIGLAGLAIGYFGEFGLGAFETFREEIIEVLLKPNKTTAVHWYLSYFQDVSEEIHKIKGNVDELDYLFNFISNTLDEVNLKPDLIRPDFENCSDKWHEECSCNEIVEQWVKYVSKNAEMINELIIHSAFQVIFLDRKFLHDFHLELSDFVESYIDEIREAYPENVTVKGRIKRTHFPKWLTDAVFYRDKGTCSICRCDLSKLIRTQNTIHIDHIVPLDIYGSNDASNFQLLCETCNTSKGARSTATSSINVPFWNL